VPSFDPAEAQRALNELNRLAKAWDEAGRP
jgi:hypothetical protein